VLKTVAFPELKAEAQNDPRGVFIDAETTTPLSYLVAPGAFDKLLAQHPECNLIVSLIGLPADLAQTKCWRDERTKFALLLPDLRFAGNAAAVKRAVQSGKLVVFVLNRPGGQPSPRDTIEEQFEKQFILVTVENVERVIEEYPQLFPGT
jgi:hypothetical protein